jgi:hypothetical protein
MLSSRLYIVEEGLSSNNDRNWMHSTVGHAPDDVESTRSTLQSFLAFLDQHYHHDRVNDAYKEIIRTCITGMLANSQSRATAVDEGTWDNSSDQAIFGEGLRPSHQYNELNAVHPLALQHLQSQVSIQAYDPLSPEPADTLREGADFHFRQLSPGLLFVTLVPCLKNAYPIRTLDLPFSHISGPVPVDYELDAKPFQSFVPEMGTCSEEQTLSCSSASRHQQLRLPVVRAGQKKVRCTWLGCSRVVKKDSYARHVDECHLGKVRDVCTGCGRVFPRMYMKKDHLCHGSSSKRRSS